MKDDGFKRNVINHKDYDSQKLKDSEESEERDSQRHIDGGAARLCFRLVSLFFLIQA